MHHVLEGNSCSVRALYSPLDGGAAGQEWVHACKASSLLLPYERRVIALHFPLVTFCMCRLFGGRVRVPEPQGAGVRLETAGGGSEQCSEVWHSTQLSRGSL